jgi:hypothetical protein
VSDDHEDEDEDDDDDDVVLPSVMCGQAVVESNTMVLATSDCYVLRWRLDRDAEPDGTELIRY